ncbi:MAG: TetR/AcrR family transcriptional regulator [Segniliparus sp.]|uniref:TetR/AcrR family transcriptional regulator n=1 Tax=Segniliparus sp. TaxID=2804064 RepID=UPI003F4079FB
MGAEGIGTERMRTPGRPRLSALPRRGETAREEILDVAAELFTTEGYGSVSTRKIAELAGFRQASLYHYFDSKEDILTALLGQTVDVAVALAERLAGREEPAPVRLYALAFSDSAQLGSSRWNLGALYLLPEVRGERFAAFHAKRAVLRGRYEALALEAAAESGCPVDMCRLPFRLVESVIITRGDFANGPQPSGGPGMSPELIADAVLRMLGCSGGLAPIRAQALALLDALIA